MRIDGRMFGKPVNGLGFDERSCPRVRDFEVAEALRLTAEHLPDVDDDTRAHARLPCVGGRGAGVCVATHAPRRRICARTLSRSLIASPIAYEKASLH